MSVRGAGALAAALVVAMTACGEFPPTLSARRALAAAELGGLIYAAGGWNGEATQLARVEVFDPVTQRWRPGVDLEFARSQHGLVTVKDRLYAVGGWSADRGLVSEIETWAPGEPRWRVAGRLPTPRREPGVAVLEGRFVVAGGFNGASDADLDGYGSIVEVFDPASGVWASLPSLGTPRRGLALVNVKGALYAIGGFNPWDGYLKTVERLDPGALAWRELSWPIAPRTWTAGLVDDGDIVLLGGFGPAGALGLVERIIPGAGTVCLPPRLITARSWLAASLMRPGAALTLGGETPGGFSGAVEVNSTQCIST